MSPSGQHHEPRVTVIQERDRMRYAVPIALQRAGALERVYTDWYTRPGSIEAGINAVLKIINPSRARRMARRYAGDLDASRVHSKPILVFSQFLGRRHFRKEMEYYSWMADEMAQWVLDKGFGESNGLFGYVRGIFPGLASTARHQGLKVITDQTMAPFSVEHAEALKQRERFPDWMNPAAWNDRALSDFERGTWESSNLVTCGSEYVRECLINAGVEAKKVAVLPYPCDPEAVRPVDRRGRTGAITVGFVGQVGLRKGTPYFLQAAKKVDPAKAKFVMVGPLAIDRVAIEQYRGEVQLTGDLPRRQVLEWLGKFDVLLFPSTCEGAASAVTDAMLAGLPVVTSPNSGSLVRHGVDGFVTGYDDVDRMADYITRLAGDADLRRQMGTSARLRAETFHIDHYGRRLKDLYRSLLSGGA